MFLKKKQKTKKQIDSPENVFADYLKRKTQSNRIVQEVLSIV
jgi:hypothetical protein